jgi:hypothetical protein
MGLELIQLLGVNAEASLDFGAHTAVIAADYLLSYLSLRSLRGFCHYSLRY